MARRKNPPEAVRTKCDLAERLRVIRTELYGERGGPEVARRLSLPIRTWYNYESGVTVPAEVLLKFIELTSVEPQWLLRGSGSRYRAVPPLIESLMDPAASVEALLRTALQRLGRSEVARKNNGLHLAELASETARRLGESHAETTSEAAREAADGRWEGLRLKRADDLDGPPWTPVDGPLYQRAYHELVTAEAEGRSILVEDEAMTPQIPKGSSVSYSRESEALTELDGHLVVAWVDNKPLARWLQHTRHYILLRPGNPEFDQTPILIEVDSPPADFRARAVEWIGLPGVESSPHPGKMSLSGQE